MEKNNTQIKDIEKILTEYFQYLEVLREDVDKILVIEDSKLPPGQDKIDILIQKLKARWEEYAKKTI